MKNLQAECKIFLQHSSDSCTKDPKITKKIMREVKFVYLFGFRIEQKASICQKKNRKQFQLIEFIQKKFLDTYQKER